ncbi:uncharacterized protein CANTADRAFT_91019 [Suhomyces tanzawaensis NRRL Y-17324]|uniref:Phosphatidylserine decarboxylase proenzyme 2 n=1 Tax=Suhomyces tanzawaensis NRRL Y-17324 TaxID=984487 RepID=A0A1E4SGS3_9ASCO|nr:uncharacterized protein CANTADRAFT_91019 [Suhomyces tanzawaensis NRRL Y-17324]ODV78717.1 hypothetical protein CANTADRAFT_91019 [Suhomyces tanzawaensis NRRL Y-17324]
MRFIRKSRGTGLPPDHQLYVKINANRAADLVPGVGHSKDDTVAAMGPSSSRKAINPCLVALINTAKKRTARKLNTNQPSWNAEISLPLNHGDYSQTLVLTVWDKHKRYKNYLGELRVCLGELFYSDGKFHSTTDLKWHKLYSNKQQHSFVTGSLLASFELVVKKIRAKKWRKRDRLRLKGPEKLCTNDKNELKPTTTPGIVVVPPSRSGTAELSSQLNSMDIADITAVAVEAPESTKKVIFDKWLRSVIYSSPGPGTTPDDQGFYSDTNEVAATADVSDIESIVTSKSELAPSEQPEPAKASPENSKWLGVSLDVADASSMSDASMLSSDGPTDSADTSKPKLRKKLTLLKKLKRQQSGKFELSNRKVLGVLFIEIISCSDLPPIRNLTRTSFDMDPFVVVTFGRKTFRTSWKRHNLNPIFNERLAFEILSHEANFNIQFNVLDKDHLSYHDKVADITLPMNDLLDMVDATRETPASFMPLGGESDTEMTEGPDETSDSQNSSIQILEGDNMVQHVKKKKFMNRKKITYAYADTSKFKTMNLALKLENEKLQGKYNPQLKVRVRFETYEELRRKFWGRLLEQFSLNDSESYDYFELMSLLDTLGCVNSDELVASFYESYQKSPWGGDLLTHDQIIDSLESHIAEENAINLSSKIFEIERCPICLQKRFSKKQDLDIVTHFAICASKDWSIVNKLLVSSYVTPQIATKKWISKFLIKLTYGTYKLGGNSANILVQDRTTGIIMEEKMGIYIRLGIRLLYNGLDKAKSRRIRTILKKMSLKQGIKFDSPSSRNDIESFVKFHKLDMSDFKQEDITKYATFNEFFYRELKQGARPLEGKKEYYSKIMTSPADSRCVAFSNIDDATEFWIKGKNFTIAKLFNGNFNNLENTDLFKLSTCSLGIFRLAPQDYHRFHSPIDGKIGKIKYIDGEYYTVNPMAIRSDLDVFGENVRAIIPIETEEFGTVIMIPVGAMMVGSIVLTKEENQHVKKGEEMGYFKFGGSTIIVLVESKNFRFDSDLLNNSLTSVETLVRVGQSVGHSNDIPEVTRDKIDFDKQSNDFKVNLIRVLTGGDLSDKHELSNWESSNLKITGGDLEQIANEDEELGEFDSYDEEDEIDEEEEEEQEAKPNGI